MKDIAIIKDSNGLYYFEVYKRTDSIYRSESIYTNILILDNLFEAHHQCDLLLLTNDEGNCVFDAWQCKMIISKKYDNIKIVEHHMNIIFICELDKQYYFYDINGNAIFNDAFNKYFFIGDFYNKYMYIIENENGVGVITIDGNRLIIPDTKYIFEYYRLNNYIVLKKHNHMYDIFNYSGLRLYEDSKSYEMLEV